MRGVLEPPRLRDVGYRLLRFLRIAQVLATTLQAGMPDEVVNRAVDLAQCAMQATLGSVEITRDRIERQLRVVQVLPDILPNPVPQTALHGNHRLLPRSLVDGQIHEAG